MKEATPGEHRQKPPDDLKVSTLLGLPTLSILPRIRKIDVQDTTLKSALNIPQLIVGLVDLGHASDDVLIHCLIYTTYI